MAKKSKVSIAPVILGILFLTFTLSLIQVANDHYEKEKSEMHGHHDDGHKDDGHSHKHDSSFEVNASQAPSVNVIVTEDPVNGWNVRLETSNFRFTPENVNGENVIGEGHAHLYVDGNKVARLYSDDFHYPETFDGTRTFRVTLNANDHSEYAVDGVVIDGEVQVTHEAHN